MELASPSSVLRDQARLQPQGFTGRDLGYLPSIQAIQMDKFYSQIHGKNKQMYAVRDKPMKKKKKREERVSMVRKAPWRR